MKYANIKEEELKNKTAQDYFWLYDCSKIVGNIDFCVAMHGSQDESLLWAEAKKGVADMYNSLTQLILTIGKARTFDKFLPPSYLGSFDAEKIAFVPYSEIADVFYLNDFNWNVAASNYDTREFKLIHEKVKNTITEKTLLFNYQKDDLELKNFIKTNFIVGKFGITKTRIDKNNFMVIYNKWLGAVKPTIAVNWEIAKKTGIIDGDFYLADLLSQENNTLKEKLYVLLKHDHYTLERSIDQAGMFSSKRTEFKDKQAAHTLFWNRYVRPPREEYWDYIVERRDLLVPQDVRERKGSFFTPQIWVELSQQYLADVLGEDWQDEYYIWDCAAGTGNLLAGLTNKYHIYASTLDRQDVEVMHDRIQNGANLLENQVFQFDFLNDDLFPSVGGVPEGRGGKLPQSLQDIINDPEKRKKLVIYINPPYAEASDKKTFGRIEGKAGVEQSKMNKKYASLLGQGNAELFAQFLIRINKEIPDCILGQFSTLKALQGQHFVDFRQHFSAKLERLFLIPADTFDNVKGKFPIGFSVWKFDENARFENIIADVYDKNGKQIGTKLIESYTDSQYINDWVKPYRADIKQNQLIGKFPFKGSDFQNQNIIQIVHHKMPYNTEAGQFHINQKNVIYAAIYFAVRKCIDADWLNDRDQFLYPNEGWKHDTEFQNDCLAYTLFSNNIQSQYGTNHWIPFTENEVNAMAKFESNFMAKYLVGKIDTEITFDLFHKIEKKQRTTPLQFSPIAMQVFEAGKALWRYYHESIKNIPAWSDQKPNVNASLYDIREYFQGRNDKGKMNNKSQDENYSLLISDLRESLKTLALKIEPKIYEFGFLKA